MYESDIVYAIQLLQDTIERLARVQEQNQKEILESVQKIEASVYALSLDTASHDAIERVASDVSLIADRYRPVDDEWSS